MIAAVASSSLFLAGYLYFHSQAGVVRYSGAGWMRTVYFGILIPHTILAATLVVLVPLTLALALRGNFARHRAWARWTYPVWLFVSVTGVVIYFMLYW